MLSFEKHIHTLNNGVGLLEGLLCFYDLTDSIQKPIIIKAREHIKKVFLLYLEETERRIRNAQEGYVGKFRNNKLTNPFVDEVLVHKEIKNGILKVIYELESLPRDTKPDYVDGFIKDLSAIIENQTQKVSVYDYPNSLDDSLSSMVTLRCEMEG